MKLKTGVRLLASFLFVVFAVGCAPSDSLSNASTMRVTHVVICWLKQPGDAESRRELTEASQSFRKLPGVQDVLVGTAIPSTRPVVDSSYDLSIIMVFKDEAALRAYESSPQHQQAVRNVLQPRVARFVIYDAQEHPLASQ